MDSDHRSLTEKAPLGVTSIVLDALFLGLAGVALGIRLRSRSIQGNGLCFNDYAALCTWVRKDSFSMQII